MTIHFSDRATVAAQSIEKAFNIVPDGRLMIGVILGTGWDVLPIRQAQVKSLNRIDALPRVETVVAGHARTLAYGAINGVPVVVLRGRYHLNESLDDPDLALMVRLQTMLLLHLGVKTLIVTSAVGSLVEKVRVGDFVVVDGLVQAFAPQLPLFAGEFCSPEDALDPSLQMLACSRAVKVKGLRVVKGGHVMLRGPNFEGRKYDKKFLAATGASVVGMSMLPEVAVASLFHQKGVRALGLGFVTNGAFEVHSHEENQRRARAAQGLLGEYLSRLIAAINRSVPR